MELLSANKNNVLVFYDKRRLNRKMEMFCVKCRKKVSVDDNAVQKETTSKGRILLRATCPVCGSKITKFAKSTS